MLSADWIDVRTRLSEAIMLSQMRTLQSSDAGIRREAGRTGALRDHDGRAARSTRRDHGHDYRCHGPGRAARRLLPEPTLAGEAGDGYPDHYEKSDRCQGVNPERDGAIEKESVIDSSISKIAGLKNS